MKIDRRTALTGIGSAVSLAALTSPVQQSWAKGTPTGPIAALLLPLSGEHAPIARSMERAALLAQAATEKKRQALVLDTGGTAAGAGAAAQRAVHGRAPILLGPLFSTEVHAVAAAMTGRPIIAFSNDEDVRLQGGFVFGVTAAQLTGGVLRYARGRGIRRVAVIATDSAWSRQCVRAARRLQAEVGYDMTEIRHDPATDRQALLARANAGAGVEAIFVAEVGEPLITTAALLRDGDPQILGVGPLVEPTPQRMAALRGAWLGSPDPDAFADFARRYEGAAGAAPGILAGLAYDAVTIAAAVADMPDPATALRRAEGFAGVLGRVRMGAEGEVRRQVAVLQASADGLTRLQAGIWA